MNLLKSISPKVFLLVAFLAASLLAEAQGPPNTNDCLGALNMCEGYYYEENAPTGNGSYVDNLPSNGCAMVAGNNMGWYQLTTQTAGILNFSLTPNGTDDYDWILFNLTDASCDEISSNPDLVVSCNTYGLTGSNGATGISTSNGGTGNANGPGNTNGPAFNADLNVEAGETYVLMISNWSGTPNGYELDFGESTATFVDNIPPEIESVDYSCDGTVEIVFSEYIDCATALPAYFTVEGPGGPYMVESIESACDEGSEYGFEFTLSFTGPFLAGEGVFNFIFEANELADVCGNFLLPIVYPIEVPEAIEFSTTTTPAACGDDNGSLSVEVVSGGVAPFYYSVNGVNFQSSATFTDLAPGDYTVTVKDDNGCISAVDVTVGVDVVEFSAGADANVCLLSYTGNATVPAGYTGSWSAPAGIEMNNSTSPNCIFVPQTVGTYTFTWTITNGVNCTVDESVEVSFNAIEVANFVFTYPTCHDKCNGTAEVTVGGVVDMDGLAYDWSGGSSLATNPESASGLCPGANEVTLTTEEGCTLTYPFVLENPEPLPIGTVTVLDESCPKFCDGSIVIENAAATEFSFDGGDHFSSASSIDNLCAGGYYITMKNSSGCEIDTIVRVNQPAGPKAEFRSKPNRQSTFSPNFEFENLSENYVSSYWQFDYPKGTDFSVLEDPKYTYVDPEVGDYTVMLTIKDSAGCTDTTFQEVGIFEDTWIYIPNSFTPNEDGLNDIFRPVLSNVVVDDYNLVVYNRWGAKVFETSDVHTGWNGSVSDSEYYGEAGAYVYRIHVREKESGEAREWNGTVMMMR